MTAIYDQIANDYEAFLATASQQPVELRNFLQVLGDIRGIHAIDLGCGSGFYASHLIDAGAASVLGIDISPAMIAMACRHARRGTTFQVGDLLSLDTGSRFGLATAMWPFCHARTPDELRRMFATAARHLRPGGRLVGWTVHPGYRLARGNFSAYGFDVTHERRSGARAAFSGRFSTMADDEFEFFQWSRPDHEEAARAAGFAGLTWHQVRVPADLKAARPMGYWNVFERNCLQVGFTGLRQASCGLPMSHCSS